MCAHIYELPYNIITMVVRLIEPTMYTSSRTQIFQTEIDVTVHFWTEQLNLF